MGFTKSMPRVSTNKVLEDARPDRPGACKGFAVLRARAAPGLRRASSTVLRPGRLPHAACADETSRTLRAKSESQRGRVNAAAGQNQGAHLLGCASQRARSPWMHCLRRANIEIKSRRGVARDLHDMCKRRACTTNHARQGFAGNL